MDYIKYYRPEPQHIFSIHYKTDGNAYEGTWYFMEDLTSNYSHQSKGLATQKTYQFHRAQFIDSKFSSQTYKGSQKDCGNSHSLTISKCEMWEDRLELIEEMGHLRSTQIGYSRSKNDYSTQVFDLRRIK